MARSCQGLLALGAQKVQNGVETVYVDSFRLRFELLGLPELSVGPAVRQKLSLWGGVWGRVQVGGGGVFLWKVGEKGK